MKSRGLTMKEDEKNAMLQNLTRIPEVGDRVAQDLFNLGYRSVDELKGQDPEAMYRSLLQRHTGNCPKAPFVIPAKGGIQRPGSLWVSAGSMRE